jgi:hypothetical protein
MAQVKPVAWHRNLKLNALLSTLHIKADILTIFAERKRSYSEVRFSYGPCLAKVTTNVGKHRTPHFSNNNRQQIS